MFHHSFVERERQQRRQHNFRVALIYAVIALAFVCGSVFGYAIGHYNTR